MPLQILKSKHCGRAVSLKAAQEKFSSNIWDNQYSSLPSERDWVVCRDPGGGEDRASGSCEGFRSRQPILGAA